MPYDLLIKILFLIFCIISGIMIRKDLKKLERKERKKKEKQKKDDI